MFTIVFDLLLDTIMSDVYLTSARLRYQINILQQHYHCNTNKTGEGRSEGGIGRMKRRSQ